MKKILAANRGEIAIRIMRAATELGLRTATIYSDEDRLSLHRFKADEAYVIGHGKGPVAAYMDVDGIMATDQLGRDGQGHQVFKFNQDGEVLMTLGTKGIGGEGPDTFNVKHILLLNKHKARV